MSDYPLVKTQVYVEIGPASETLSERNDSPDPRTGGSSGPATQGRVSGRQPGFDVAGIPVMTIDAEVAETLAGP